MDIDFPLAGDQQSWEINFEYNIGSSKITNYVTLVAKLLCKLIVILVIVINYTFQSIVEHFHRVFNFCQSGFKFLFNDECSVVFVIFVLGVLPFILVNVDGLAV